LICSNSLMLESQSALKNIEISNRIDAGEPGNKILGIHVGFLG
jgi:hypothetical protein